jgi:hypothetical protein
MHQSSTESVVHMLRSILCNPEIGLSNCVTCNWLGSAAVSMPCNVAGMACVLFDIMLVPMLFPVASAHRQFLRHTQTCMRDAPCPVQHTKQNSRLGLVCRYQPQTAATLRGTGMLTTAPQLMRHTIRTLRACSCLAIEVHCSKIAEAEAALVCQRKEVVSDACAAAARRASGPPKPLAHCDMKVSGQLLPFC